MKKLIAILLSLVVSASCIAPISAAATQIDNGDGLRQFYVKGEGARLISVEYIPDECAKAEIPCNAISALGIPAGSDEATTYGTEIPGTKNPYDLSDGKDTISISQDTVYYSDYVYIGHGGNVMMNIKETTGTVVHDEFEVKIFVRGLFATGTIVASMAVQRSTPEAVQLYATVKEKDKVYFTINPLENGNVHLGAANNYIAKN